MPEDVDPETWRRSRARAGAETVPGRVGGAGRARRAAAGGFGDGGGDIDIEDLLGGFFGGRAGQGWGSIRGADQEAELEVTVEEAYHGTRPTVTLSGDGARATLDVNIPPGVTDGQRIRLARPGWPWHRGGGQRRSVPHRAHRAPSQVSARRA